MPIRPARDSESLGTVSTLGEPVSMKRPLVRRSSMARLRRKDLRDPLDFVENTSLGEIRDEANRVEPRRSKCCVVIK